MNSKIILLLFTIGLVPLIFGNSYAQITSGGFGQSPFERDFGDVKFMQRCLQDLYEANEHGKCNKQPVPAQSNRPELKKHGPR